MRGENAIRAAIEDAPDDIWPEPDMTVIDNRRKPPKFPLEILGEWKQ